MSGAPLILAVSVAYLALLFAVAYRVDQRGGLRRGASIVYALSIAVYCTSWTWPEDQEAIFDRFRQVGDQLTDKPEGTGLGLPICRMILDHLGGSISVSSRSGHGATFTVRLPYVAEPAALAAPAAVAD